MREKIPDRELRTVRSVSDAKERFGRQGTFRAARSVSDAKERFGRQGAFRAERIVSDAGDGGRERSITQYGSTC